MYLPLPADAFDEPPETKIRDFVPQHSTYPDISVLNAPSFSKLPSDLLSKIVSYFESAEVVLCFRGISKNTATVVHLLMGREFPIESWKILLPDTHRNQASSLTVILHALLPLRAITQIENHLQIQNTAAPFPRSFKQVKGWERLAQRLKKDSESLLPGSLSFSFIQGLALWIGEEDASTAHKLLQETNSQGWIRQAFRHKRREISVPDLLPAVLWDLLALREVRGIGEAASENLDENKGLLVLKNRGVSRRERSFIRSLRLQRSLHFKKKEAQLKEAMLYQYGQGVDEDRDAAYALLNSLQNMKSPIGQLSQLMLGLFLYEQDKLYESLAAFEQHQSDWSQKKGLDSPFVLIASTAIVGLHLQGIGQEPGLPKDLIFLYESDEPIAFLFLADFHLKGMAGYDPNPELADKYLTSLEQSDSELMRLAAERLRKKLSLITERSCLDCGLD